MKSLAIIIVNYKSWKPLSRNLDALREIPLPLEIVVVDNQSGDGQLEIFRKNYPQVTFIENTGNWGFAHGCNVGAAASRADYVLFLNPDAVANTAALQAITIHLESHPEVGIVSVPQSVKASSYQKLLPRPGTLFGLFRAVYKLINRRKMEAMACHPNQPLVHPEWVSGSVVGMRRWWFERVHGWSEAYWLYYEDVDLSRRVQQAGGRIDLLCHEFIEHAHGGASRINVATEALTKAEVAISNHVYVQRHFTGIGKLVSHTLLIINNLLVGLPVAFLGTLLFFVPKLRVQSLIWGKLLRYYLKAVQHATWVSERSALRHGKGSGQRG